MKKKHLIYQLGYSLSMSSFRNRILTYLFILYCFSYIGYAQVAALELTEQEKTWLTKHPDITLGFSSELEPAVIVGEDGELSGFLIDIYNEIETITGMKVNIEIDEWSSTIQKAKDREIDGLLAATVALADNMEFNHTNTLVVGSLLIYVKSNSPFEINSEKDLIGKKVSVIKGHFVVKQELEPYKEDIEIIETDSALEMLKLVLEGKVDAAYSQSSHNYLISKHLLVGIKPVYFSSPPKAEGVAVVKPEWPELVSIMNKTLAQIGNARIKEIISKWTQIESEVKVTLTVEEKAWLKEHPVIRVGSIDNIKPLQFPTESGKVQGVFMDYLSKVSEMLGIQFELSENISGTEALRRLKAREIDMLPGTMSLAERLEHTIYTEPYLTLPTLIFTRDDKPFIGNLEQLYGKRVATIGGITLSRYLDLNYPLLEVLKVDNAENGLKGLASGELDAYVGTVMGISYAISETGYTNVKASGIAPFIYEISMAVRNDWPKLVGILQKALDEISDSERNAIYGRWISITYEHDFDYTILWRVLVIFIVVFGSAWIFLLLRQIKNRKISEQALRLSEEKFSKAFHASPDAITITSLESNCFVDVNEGFEKRTGYSREEVIGKSLIDLDVYKNPEDRVKLLDLLTTEERVRNYELDFKIKSGEIRTALNSIEKLELYGKPHIVSVTRDITDRKRAEAEITKLSKVVAQAEDIIFITDFEGNIEYVNSSFIRTTGFSYDEVIGKNPRILKSGEMDSDYYAKLWNSVLAGETYKDITINKKKNGDLFHHEQTITPLKNDKNEITHFASTGSDITERIQAEEALKGYQNNLRTLSSELTLVEERERRRIATNLHDHLTQSLAMAKIKLAGIQQEKLSSNDIEDFDDAKKFINNAIQNSRIITHELSPPILYELGLPEAITWLLNQVEDNNKIKTSMKSNLEKFHLEDDMKILLFRSINELINNSIKYANCSSIFVNLDKVKSNLKIKVWDDGIGFDQQKTVDKPIKEGGFGLFSIQERLEYSKGNMSINSRPGEGTKVVLSVPI